MDTDLRDLRHAAEAHRQVYSNDRVCTEMLQNLTISKTSTGAQVCSILDQARNEHD